MFKKLATIQKKVTRTTPVVYKKTIKFVDRRPLHTFFILLGTILLLIILSNLMPQPKQEVKIVKQAKVVSTYFIGSVPKVTVQAQIRKTGVITITALTGGVVQRIPVVEGSAINRGDLLVAMSSNYQGGNALSVQRQLAQTQYNNVLNTFPLQKDIIQKQKELANKNDENADQLREITSRSLEETRGLISLNEEILSAIDENLQELEADPAANEALILSTKQLKSQYLAATNQARSALRNSEYQAGGSNPPAQMSDISRDIALKQLEMQEKQLELNKEVTRLQLVLAQINEGLYFPTAPWRGIVERVMVKEFEAVSPGTPLMIISQAKEEDPITAIAFVPREIAQKASYVEDSILHLGSTTYATRPSFISTEAVQGTLYAIYYPLPDSLTYDVVEKGYITVDVPVGYPDTGAAMPFIPLDAVYQTRDSAYVFVMTGSVVSTREVVLGSVYGRYVEVVSGIKSGDEIILDRSVIEGDIVTRR